MNEYEDEDMAVLETPTMLATGGSGEGGIGGGLLGGILGGALLGNRGLFGGNGTGEGCVTPANLTAGLTGVTDAIQNTTVMQALGDIKAAVPLAEAQVQLALAGSTGEIRTHLGQVENGIVAGQAITNKAISDAIAASLASQNSINMNVLQMGQANLVATKDSQFATQVAIGNSTKEILAALNDQNTANLQRQLAVAESTLAEQRSLGRIRETEINITNTNTATAQQLQMQAQQQQQLQAIVQLNALVGNLANDIQVVRQGQTIFNSGTMAASGTQAAANTKVN